MATHMDGISVFNDKQNQHQLSLKQFSIVLNMIPSSIGTDMVESLLWLFVILKDPIFYPDSKLWIQSYFSMFLDFFFVQNFRIASYFGDKSMEC